MRVSRTVELPASPEVVWRMLTEPHGLAAWMGSGSAVSAARGGRARFADPETGRSRSGLVTAAVPGQRLALRWWPDDAPAERSDVEIALEPVAAGTRLTVVETAAPAVAASASASHDAATGGGILAGRASRQPERYGPAWVEAAAPGEAPPHAGGRHVLGSAWTCRLAALELALLVPALLVGTVHAGA